MKPIQHKFLAAALGAAIIAAPFAFGSTASLAAPQSDMATAASGASRDSDAKRDWLEAYWESMARDGN